MDSYDKNNKKTIDANLLANIKKIKADFGETNDLLIREVVLQDGQNTKAVVLGMDGLIDTTNAQDFVVKLLTADFSMLSSQMNSDDDSRLLLGNDAIFDFLFDSWISLIDAKKDNSVETLYNSIMSGKIIVMIDDVPRFMMFDCKGWQSRSIGTPSTEKSLWGPKDSFVETIRFNTAMLRRRLRDPNLRFDAHSVGKRSKTDVFVAYIEGLTNPEFIRIANERIKAIDIDSISNAYELIQLIEDKHHSLLPRLIETERPDRTMKALTEGQVAIFVDGSPYAILGPFFFTSAFSAIDDYYNHPVLATIKRILRYFAFFLIILVPGLYIALSTFHHEMLPTPLLISILNQHSSNPFSTFTEIFVVTLLFELLREASLRKPDSIGDSMTIVGSLIIGTTIVESGLVSYTTIIVAAITAISSFVLSNSRINVAARLFKFLFMIIFATYGLFGGALAFIVLITHLVSLTSFNQAYLAPMAPFNLSDQRDQIIRMPLWLMNKRAKIFKTLDVKKSNIERDHNDF